MEIWKYIKYLFFWKIFWYHWYGLSITDMSQKFYVRKIAVKHKCAETDSCHQLFCEKILISLKLQ